MGLASSFGGTATLEAAAVAAAEANNVATVDFLLGMSIDVW